MRLITKSIYAVLLVLLLMQQGVAEEYGHADRYPAVRAFLDSLDFRSFPPVKGELKDRWWCEYDPAVEVPDEKMKELFLAGVRDRITVIRLFALMAEHIRSQKVALCGSGDAINKVLETEQIDLGLGLPMRNLAVYAWVPVFDNQDQYTVAELNLIYRKQFIHRFREEVLPADLKVGTLNSVQYKYEGEESTGFPVGLQLHVSTNKMGFEKMRGVGARPHGVLGVIAGAVPFFPDSVHSMYLEQNTLLTRALVRGHVEDFEDTPLYQMRIRSNPWH